MNLNTVASPLANCRVFVLADAAVCSATLEAAIREHLGGSSCLRDTSAMQKNVVLHVLQAGLEIGCQSSRVSRALEVNRVWKIQHGQVQNTFQLSL